MERVDGSAIVGFIVLALIPTMQTIWGVYQTKKYERYKGYTTARVTDIREYKYYSKRREICYYITFQYMVDGIIYESEAPCCYSEKNYALWSEVKICYDKKHPEKFMIEGEEKSLKREAMIWAMIAGGCWLFIIFGLIYEVFYR